VIASARALVFDMILRLWICRFVAILEVLRSLHGVLDVIDLDLAEITLDPGQKVANTEQGGEHYQKGRCVG